MAVVGRDQCKQSQEIIISLRRDPKAANLQGGRNGQKKDLKLHMPPPRDNPTTALSIRSYKYVHEASSAQVYVISNGHSASLLLHLLIEVTPHRFPCFANAVKASK
jgi:hypothetical protein